MSKGWLRRWLGLMFAGVIAAGGCGQAPPSAENQASRGAAAEEGGAALPTASIGAPIQAKADEDEEPEEPDEDEARVELQEGSPEWLVREATKLRLEPPPKTEDIEELQAHRRQRNEKIVEHCQKAISEIHEDPQQERLFGLAVRNLLEARLQLALTGDRDAIAALYEDAAALFKRDPKSAAAAEGAHTLVNLAYSHAQAGGASGKQWLEEFARQATHFATAFPGEERRGVPLLFTAARSCELAGMTQEAINAYSLIQQNFPQNAYALRVAAVIRRLKLPGNPPQLAGPTLDGEQVVLDDLLGQVVLVVFWSSEARPFAEAIGQLKEAIRTQSRQGLKVIGVNMDTDPTSASQFCVEHRIGWPQIIFSEAGKQGWNNPIAAFYGILEIPAYWLIDQSGNVVSTTVTLETLASDVEHLLAAGKIRPEGAGGAVDRDSATVAEDRPSDESGTDSSRSHPLTKKRPRVAADKPADQ